ncbi:MAG: hypothetical protein MK008_11280 [Bdellovibrionales bacterium]|nr:hypothetical protein [Bdellovibrionales bacterium]
MYAFKHLGLILTLSLFIISCSDDKSDPPQTTSQQSDTNNQQKDNASSQQSENTEAAEKTDQTLIQKSADEIANEIVARAEGKDNNESKKQALEDLENEFETNINEITQRMKERKQQIEEYLEGKLAGLLDLSIQDPETLTEDEIIKKYISLTIPEAPLHTDEGIKALSKNHLKDFFMNQVLGKEISKDQIQIDLHIKKVTQSPDSLAKDNNLAPNSRQAYKKLSESDDNNPIVLSNNSSNETFSFKAINAVSGIKSQTNGEVTVKINLKDDARLEFKNINIFIAESKNLLIAESNEFLHPALLQVFTVEYNPDNVVVEHYPSKSTTQKYVFNTDKINSIKDYSFKHHGVFVAQNQSILANQQKPVAKHPQAYDPSLPSADTTIYTKIKTTITSWFKEDHIPRMNIVEDEIKSLQNAYLEYRDSYLTGVKNKLNSIKELSSIEDKNEQLLEKIKSGVSEDLSQLRIATENRYDKLIQAINENFESMENYTDEIKAEKQKFISMLQKEKNKRQSQIEEQLNSLQNQITTSELYQQQKKSIDNVFEKISNAFKPEDHREEKQTQ